MAGLHEIYPNIQFLPGMQGAPRVGWGHGGDLIRKLDYCDEFFRSLQGWNVFDVIFDLLYLKNIFRL